MSIAIVMPQLGLTMEEGTVSVWLKNIGDSVKKDEALFSVATDKVEMDVEASASGTLTQIVVPAGETVKVGTIVAYLAGDGDTASSPASTSAKQSAPADQKADSKPGNAPKSASISPPASRQSQLSSPRAKRLAKELGVDLAAVRGSGTNGTIAEEDVRKASSEKTKSPAADGRHRQLIAERLTQSIQTIPTFSVAAEANAEHLLVLYDNLKPTLGQSATVKLTITDLLLAAFAQVLKASPEIRSIWKDNRAHVQNSVDVGLAVATEKGVIAPVIHDAASLDLAGLVSKRSQLVQKAREGRLAFADFEGGTGTLSNLGMYRVDNFQAIISPGQSSILAVGQIRKRPWAEESLTIKPTVMLNLTVDHRVADGAAAAIFLGKLIELIENPKDLSLAGAGRATHKAGDRNA